MEGWASLAVGCAMMSLALRWTRRWEPGSVLEAGERESEGELCFAASQ